MKLTNLKKKLSVVLTSCLLMSALGGCGTDTAGDSASAPAKDKGEITIYTSQPETDIQKLIAAFNKEKPDIQVHVFRSGTEEVVSKVMAEKQAGSIQADILLVADASTFETMKNEDLLMSYASPELKGIRNDFYDKEHTYTGTKVISTGIAYNTKLIQEPPRSLRDLAKPEFKGRLIMPSPLYSGAAAYNLSVLTRTEGLGWEYYHALKANGVKVDKGNGSVQKAIVDGQQGIGLLADYMALRSRAKGAPIEFIYPSEGSLIVTEPVGILKTSKNPDAAKSFVDFILSDAGQKVTAEIGYTPVKSGIQPPAGFKSVDELTNLTFDLSVLVKSRAADKEQFTQLFQ